MRTAVRILSITILLVGLASFSYATTFANRPLGEVVKEAPHIVRGQATAEPYSDWDKSGRRSLYTYTPFLVVEVLKGDLKRDSQILLRQPGGSKDGLEMNVPGTARFAQNEEVVVLLSQQNQDGSYDVPGLTTGKYQIVEGENGEPELVNSLGGGMVYDPAANHETLSYNARIPLEVFRQIARGEQVPESLHKQFERGAKPGEDEHHPPRGLQSEQSQESEQQAVAEARPAKRSIWLPMVFALLALVGALGLWRIISRKGR